MQTNGAYKSIHIAFGNAQTSHLHFKTSTESLGRLFASDLNRDRDADLIWVPQQHLGQAVIWLGNGRGQFKLSEKVEGYQTALASLDAGAAETQLTQTTAGQLPALCAAQFHYVAAAHRPSPFKPATSINNPSDNADCQALQQLANSICKRGPPPAAV